MNNENQSWGEDPCWPDSFPREFERLSDDAFIAARSVTVNGRACVMLRVSLRSSKVSGANGLQSEEESQLEFGPYVFEIRKVMPRVEDCELNPWDPAPEAQTYIFLRLLRPEI
jgi:hypothetical protein